MAETKKAKEAKTETLSAEDRTSLPEDQGDAKERAASAGLNPDGIDDSPMDVSSLQEAFDRVNERGFMGTVPDPTPNENYTVEGVGKGLPTPETDPDLYDQARDAAIGHPLRDIDRSSAQNAGAKEVKV